FITIDIQQVLDAVVSLMRVQARRTNVQIEQFEAPAPAVVLCDPNQIKQVFVNLIKNAIEAMPKGGQIMIQVSVADDFVRIAIQDEGVGIPSDIISKLGEPFFTTKEKGTGLGLMICHKILQDHGGRLNIHSELGQGTTMTVELPLSSADHPSIVHSD
ncbi:MAG: HAMP domain-containing histidine kinase, partial [Alicyclobacillus sp.]|nr:HAMP domain-containing histidine kinase [Alicyclobacillus sp.]